VRVIKYNVQLRKKGIRKRNYRKKLEEEERGMNGMAKRARRGQSKEG
jgi:hypothetical protein